MTLLNREHYRSNIHKAKKRVVFRYDEQLHGHLDLISISDLISSRPRFPDSNGEFLIELSLSRVRTVVEKTFHLQTNQFQNILLKNSPAFHHLTSGQFCFGSFSWSVSLSPEPLDMSDKVCVHLNRDKTNKQHINKMLSKLRYRFFTGQGESKSFTDLRQEMLGCGDRGASWIPAVKLSQLFKGNFQVMRAQMSRPAFLARALALHAPPLRRSTGNYVSGHFFRCYFLCLFPRSSMFLIKGGLG